MSFKWDLNALGKKIQSNLSTWSVRPLRIILHEWRRSQFGRVTMEIGGSPKRRCSIFALLSSAARYSATPRTGMLPSTWFPKQEEKKTGELLFGELQQLHKRLEGSSAYGERKKTRDLVQKSIQLIWEGTDLPRESTEYRSETRRQVFVLMQSAHVGTCTQNKSFARELIIIGVFCSASWS